MKRMLLIIVAFLLLGIFTCVGYFATSPIWGCVGTISSTVLGAVVAIILEAVDTHGQGFKLWLQHLKYYKKDVRLSFSYLFRIPVNGRYLLVKGSRLKNQYQPVGGVYKYYTEAKPALESFGYRPDIRMGNADEIDDLRIVINGKHLLQFVNWFTSMQNREYDPTREFSEELINTGLIPAEEFSTLEYRKIGIHNAGVQYSKHTNCDELIYADIFELKLSKEQAQAILDAVSAHPDRLCLATAEELKSECYNGIEKNIGNNAIWLLGER